MPIWLDIQNDLMTSWTSLSLSSPLLCSALGLCLPFTYFVSQGTRSEGAAQTRTLLTPLLADLVLHTAHSSLPCPSIPQPSHILFTWAFTSRHSWPPATETLNWQVCVAHNAIKTQRKFTHVLCSPSHSGELSFNLDANIIDALQTAVHSSRIFMNNNCI